jgi:Uri superfamily endonuclease
VPELSSTPPSPFKGIYALVLRSGASVAAEIGRWGRFTIRPGYYVYVGSAFGPGGVLARVSRHCQKAKNKHWHIDYLREFTDPAAVWYSHSSDRLEHCWAEALAIMNHMKPVKGFGCSDCKCESHLFFIAKKPPLEKFADTVGGSVKSWSCDRGGQT